MIYCIRLLCITREKGAHKAAVMLPAASRPRFVDLSSLFGFELKVRVVRLPVPSYHWDADGNAITMNGTVV